MTSGIVSLVGIALLCSVMSCSSPRAAAPSATGPAPVALHDWPSDEGMAPLARMKVHDLLNERWSQSSRIPLGSAADQAAIEKLVLDRLHVEQLKGDRPSIEETRWPSRDEAMVRAYRPVEAGILCYVLRRYPDGWRIIRAYVLGIA